MAASVDVHFESKDGGFFLKHNPRQFYTSNQRPDLLSTDPSTTSSSSSSVGASTVLSIDKFTVFQTSEPVSVRASYGPFSTKQTVPARYIVPDPLDALPMPNLDPKKSNVSGQALIDVQELGARHLDMSAHVVSVFFYMVFYERDYIAFFICSRLMVRGTRERCQDDPRDWSCELLHEIVQVGGGLECNKRQIELGHNEYSPVG